MNSASLTPASVLIRPERAEWKAAGRLWQGIPGIERTKGGRLFALWYSGGATEEPGNVVILEMSDDDGRTWTDGLCVIHHENENVRCFDPCIWIDPTGRMWVFWAQSNGFYDGRAGVWCAVCENPDGEIRFGEARRLFDGVMLNKPIAATDGTWYFPTAVWSRKYITPSEEHPELDGSRLALAAATRDRGETFEIRGGADIPGRTFDEHMFVERADGSLWLLARAKYGIGQAFSSDRGVTWRDMGPSGLTGPNARFCIRRLKSGNLILVNHFNPAAGVSPGEWNTRDNLMAFLSEDDGATWRGALVIDARRSVSYPDLTQADNGDIYLIYDWQRYDARQILMAVFNEEDVLRGGGGRLRQTVSAARGVREGGK